MTGAGGEEVLRPLLDRANVGVAVLDAEGRYTYVNPRLAELNGSSVEDHIGRTFRDVIPHLGDTVGALHAEVLATGEPRLDVQMRGSTVGAPDRVWQASYLPIRVAGERAVGVVLIDVTERERALAASDRRAGQHAAVADLGRQALAGAPVPELFEAACATLRRELRADMATVFESAEEMRAQRAVSVIGAPIAGDGTHGVLAVFSREHEHFDEDDEGLVAAVANVLGTAVARDEQAQALADLSGQRGRLVAQALAAGEREQRQVADVLHDDVLQLLLFARQELADAGGDAEAIERARKSVDDATALLRRVVAGLHPVTLVHAGLAAALENVAAEQCARTGLRSEVRVAPDAEGVHDRLLVSVARELLVNVARHATAQRALIEVSRDETAIELCVADDGRGMPDDVFRLALARGNLGLATIRERAEALGGMARVCAGLDGRGTGVQVRLPT